MRRLKKKCRRGHLFTKRNTYIDGRGARNCLKCRRICSLARSKNPGIGSGGINKSKTICPAGHPYKGKNVWVRTRFGKTARVCKTCARKCKRENRIRLKLLVIQKYGGKCTWKGCEIVDPDMLTLDHVNNDGALDRIRGISSGDLTYRKVLKIKKSKRFQLLCANHNLKKEILRKRAAQI